MKRLCATKSTCDDQSCKTSWEDSMMIDDDDDSVDDDLTNMFCYYVAGVCICLAVAIPISVCLRAISH